MEQKVVVVNDTEKKMVKMLSDGMKGNNIATELGVNENTLAFNLAELRNKVGCRNSTQLVAYFLRNKLIN